MSLPPALRPTPMPVISTTPTLWFDGTAEEAAAFYCSVFPNSRITGVLRYPEGVETPGPSEPGSAMLVRFELDGRPFAGLNGGPQFTFSEAISFEVVLDTQEEVDHYWDALLAGGGQEGPCGWLKDRFGVSWQIVPKGMDELFGTDPAAAGRAMQAMFGMRKLDLATLRAAAEGVPAA